ncbi:MAG: iron-sulfur cluster-binding domain-containing protein [Chitinophagaceae bacterium]
MNQEAILSTIPVLIIIEIIEETAGVKTFRLAPNEGETLDYSAGQFLTMEHPFAGQIYRRSYSFSSCPDVDEQPAITVKRVGNGIASRWLIDEAKVGDQINSHSRANGVFTLPDEEDSPDSIWLFAAGIGITPIFSLLKEALFKGSSNVVLVYSNHSKESTVFLEEIAALENDFKERFSVLWLWSNAVNLLQARLSRESFSMLLKPVWPKNLERVLCFICGPKSYMWMTQLLLEDAGIPAEHIRREAFQTREIVHDYLPADKESHKVTIEINSQEISFTNLYPTSILDSALALGIQLPYSCKTGQCGACTAICTQGKVWMSYNEVLTEKDLKKGRILTCKGHAVDGDIRLQFS